MGMTPDQYQTAKDFQPLLLLVSNIVVSILVSLVTSLMVRRTAERGEQGKLDARFEALGKIVKEAHSTETAKLEARFDSQARIIEESRRLAMANEGIKNSFSHQAWLREKRLECYVTLLAALERYADSCTDVATKDSSYLDACNRDWPDERLATLQQAYHSALDKHLAALGPVINSLFRVNLLASPDILALLTSVLPSNNLTKPEHYQDEFQRFAALVERFAEAARTDMLHGSHAGEP